MNCEPSDAAWKDACAPQLLIEARTSVLIAVFIAITYVLCGSALGQGTVFTYQGKLADLGTPANGNYDFEFKLFDTATVGSGSQQGSTIQRLNVAVANGAFNVSLDFGGCTHYGLRAERCIDAGFSPMAATGQPLQDPNPEPRDEHNDANEQECETRGHPHCNEHNTEGEHDRRCGRLRHIDRC